MPLIHITIWNTSQLKGLFLNGLKLGLSALLLITSINTSATEFFRWKDENGNLHFTDKPPPGKDFVKVKAANKASEEEKEPEKKEVSPLAAVTAERCKKEKERLDILQNNTNIKMSNGDGTTFALTTEQIALELERAKKNVATYCEK